MGLSLERLALSVAEALTGEDASHGQATIDALLRGLVKYHKVDLGYLRANDHEIKATILIGEWPRRKHVPAPDPLGVVYFKDADPVFAAMEHFKDVYVTGRDDVEYIETVERGSGIRPVSSVGVPLLGGTAEDPTTIGALGFVKFGDREWAPKEIAGLQAVADWMTQFEIHKAA